MDLPFSPYLTLGALRMSWHSVFAFVGALVAGTISIRLARYLVRDERTYAFAIWVLVGGLLTARLGHVADNWAFYAPDPLRILEFWQGGIAVMAAPVGATIFGAVGARRLGLPVRFMLDAAAIGIVLGLAVGRIGDVINGEHHATACSGLRWCVRYTSPDTLGQRVFVQPVVVYDMLADLLIVALALACWRAVRGRPPEGRVYLLVLGLYGLGRAITSTWRLDPVVLGPFQEGQVLGALYACGSLPLLAVIDWRARRRPASARAEPDLSALRAARSPARGPTVPPNASSSAGTGRETLPSGPFGR